MEKARILVIDDEEIVRGLLMRTLSERGYDVEAAEDGSAALEKIKERFFNLLMTDLKMPRLNGMEVLKEIKEINPYIEVVIITGYPTIETAVEAIKIGAFDYICKPFDIREMENAVIRCLEKQRFTLNYIELSELMTLFEVSKTTSIDSNLDSLLGLILDSALQVVKAKRGFLMLRDEKTKELSIKVARGLSDEVGKNSRIKSGENICDRLGQQEKLLLVNDIEQERALESNAGSHSETESFISIPLVSKSLSSQDSILGVINITDKISGRGFTQREETLLSVLAGQATAAIENHRLYNQLQEKIEALERAIKELNGTQNQLIQAEKMAAVGQLAFGIAHEIRNPLGIILGGVEYLRSNIVNKNSETVVKDSVEKIKQSIERANNIIIELLKFSRVSKLELKSVNACELMEEVVTLIRNQAYLNNVQIERNYIEKILYVKADPTLLRQAFFNLCINAIEAMPKGGGLSLNIYLAQNVAQDKTDVVIEIIDTGKGIPKDILPNIFNPFFTTKEPGKGTGLGLSIVHLILERHNGTIDVETEVNKGTKFIIRLPMDRYE